MLFASPTSHAKAIRYRVRRVAQTTVTLTIVAFACVGLTACGGSSNATQQARSPSPQEVATYKKQHAELLELVSCAHRHGVPLPAPTPNNKINTRGVNLKGHRRKAVLNACYQKVVNNAAREEQAEQEAGPRRLGEEPPARQAQTGPGSVAFQQEHERLTAVVNCARRHRIHLPEPDAHNNINTQGLDLQHGHNKAAMDACVRKVTINTAREQEELAREQQAGPKRLGEEPLG